MSEECGGCFFFFVISLNMAKLLCGQHTLITSLPLLLPAYCSSDVREQVLCLVWKHLPVVYPAFLLLSCASIPQLPA